MSVSALVPPWWTLPGPGLGVWAVCRYLDEYVGTGQWAGAEELSRLKQRLLALEPEQRTLQQSEPHLDGQRCR